MQNGTFTTPQGTTIHFNLPAKASYVKIIDGSNPQRSILDTLHLTGNHRQYGEFMDTYTEFECDCTFGKVWVSESDIIQ